MNRLSRAERAQIIRGLVQGNSLRSTVLPLWHLRRGFQWPPPQGLPRTTCAVIRALPGEDTMSASCGARATQGDA